MSIVAKMEKKTRRMGSEFQWKYRSVSLKFQLRNFPIDRL